MKPGKGKKEKPEYKTIATNWGLEKGMLEKPVINGATS